MEKVLLPRGLVPWEVVFRDLSPFVGIFTFSIKIKKKKYDKTYVQILRVNLYACSSILYRFTINILWH